MRIFIYGRNIKKEYHNSVVLLVKSLIANGMEIAVYRPFVKFLPTEIHMHIAERIVDHEAFAKWNPQMVLSLGGDGTLLNSATLVKQTQIPVLGINFGRLGFLSSVEKEDIELAVQCIARQQYKKVERTMLYLESELPLFGEDRFALNEMTILKRDNSSMITVRAFVNGEYLTSYWGDGLIVATPTGSTAYSLSCGGPIIFPNSGNFVITPVAPHNLSLRPIILNDNSVISFEIEGRDHTYMCTLDGRMETITAKHQIAVRKSDFPFVLAELPDRSFMITMREKLTWGKDHRN